jgi:hypothetical protein
MGLPFETPGGYPDDNTTPDTGRYTDDLTTPEYDGYNHELHGGHQDAAAEDDLFEDDYDFEEDGYDGDDPGGWGPSTGPDQM